MKGLRFTSKNKALSVKESKVAFQTRTAAVTPRYSFDAQVERDLSEWARISQFGLCLVHAVGNHALHDSELFKGRAQDVLRGWDVLSTSLIIRRRAWTQVGVRKPDQWGLPYTGKPTPMYANVGLILRVPPENILGTFPTDVYFPTHAPAKNYEFATKVLYGDAIKIPFVREGGYTTIESPLSIMNKTMTASCLRNYNEILVVGRPHARVHFPETKEVEVQGIIYSPDTSALIRREDEKSLPACAS